MAAQLRTVLPPSSPFPLTRPSGIPSYRAQGFSLNHDGPCFLSVSAHGSTGKHFHTFSAPSASSSPISTGSYEASELIEVGGGGGGSFNGYGGKGGGGDGRDDFNADNEDRGDSVGKGGLIGALMRGWNERVNADPQFPFKVLMEQIVGVGASVIGDMASRPNFGLNELDFVFSTLVVGSILNFSLMYMLAPTSAAASTASMLPFIFSSCPPGHMFEKGAYSVLDRFGTCVYKGAVFAAVGFGAGLFGTFISNLLIGFRKKMDPGFEPQNKAPSTLLNASTWAIHMGLSSNLRYQLINGMEFAMANVLPPPVFKGSVFCIRACNNVLGGFSFVMLARLTGSQKKAEAGDVPPLVAKGLEASISEAEKPNSFNTELALSENQATSGEDITEVGSSTPQKEDDARS
eukprot:c18918_g1_i1 orf=265-1476(-)